MKDMIYKKEHEKDVLHKGNYKGFDFAIISYGTHPCAYVKLPNEHKYFGKNYDDIPIECHCGLTYSDSNLLPDLFESGWWIGWDYAHCYDYSGYMMGFDSFTNNRKWQTSEILSEVENVINQLVKGEK